MVAPACMADRTLMFLHRAHGPSGARAVMDRATCISHALKLAMWGGCAEMTWSRGQPLVMAISHAMMKTPQEVESCCSVVAHILLIHGS